jgi:hypothetical protein
MEYQWFCQLEASKDDIEIYDMSVTLLLNFETCFPNLLVLNLHLGLVSVAEDLKAWNLSKCY